MSRGHQIPKENKYVELTNELNLKKKINIFINASIPLNSVV